MPSPPAYRPTGGWRGITPEEQTIDSEKLAQLIEHIQQKKLDLHSLLIVRNGFIKAFSHNGYFKSLEEIVHFYNTRDVPGAGWPAPEVAANVNTTELGNLGLNKGEELAIVAFLKTLSDGYMPK